MMNDWPDWSTKIIEFSKLESTTRPFIRKLIAGLDKCDGLADPNGMFNWEEMCKCVYHVP